MPRKPIDDGIPVRAPRSKRGVKPYLPLLMLVALGLVLVVGGCGLLAVFGIGRLQKNGDSESLTLGTTDKNTVSGTIVRFYVGDNLDFEKDKNGNVRVKPMNPALELRTKDGRLIDCLFAEQDLRVYKLEAGDKVTLRGDYHDFGPGAYQLRKCRLVD